MVDLSNQAPQRPLPQRPLMMGILNVTPDSFSDGGRWSSVDDAVAHGVAMWEQGAALVDVGGESTRPGAARVPAEEETQRVLPVIRELVGRGVPVSIDTMNSATAAAAVVAGASIVNDVSGGLADPAMYRLVAETGVRYIAMHWRGSAAVSAAPQPDRAPGSTWTHGRDGAEAHYDDVVAEVREELSQRVAEMRVWGVREQQIILDPGLGFAKTSAHNWALLGHLSELSVLGLPLLVGASRKRFLGDFLPEGAPTSERDAATAVVSALSARAGVWAVRVHDVPSTKLALDIWSAWEDGAS